jgi:anti-sigma B factor antagonist
MDLSLDVQRGEDAATVVVVGEVDLNTSEELKQTLVGLAEEYDVVSADLSGLEFIDSTGLSALLAAHKTLSRKGGRLELRRPPRMLVKMVDVVGLDDVLLLLPE